MDSYKKKLFFVVLVTLLINFYVCSFSYASSYTAVYESEELIINSYEEAETTFIVWANNYINNNGGLDMTSNTSIKNINDILSFLRSGYYIYFNRYDFNSDTDGIYIYLYSPSLIGNPTLVYQDWRSWNVNWTYTDVPGYNIKNMAMYRLNNSGTLDLVSYNTGTARFVPRACFIKYDNILDNFIKTYLGYQYVAPQQVSVVNMDNVINALNDLNDNTSETNEYLKSEDTTGVDYSVPTTNTNDITESGFNTIFYKFYNSLTSSNSGTSINIPIPFTNKTINIPSNLTYNILNNYMGGVLKSLLTSFWYFLVGLFIVKDVAHIIQDLRSGDIMEKTDTNIKTEML